MLAVGLLVGPRPAGASTSQFPPETTVAPGFPTATTLAPGFPTATTGVLVPGSTAATTTSVPASGPTQVEEAPAADTTGDPSANRTVWMAIAGLGLVAFLILVLTIIYARYTRPERWKGGVDWTAEDDPDTAGDPEKAFAPTAARSVFEHHEDEQGFWWAED